MADERETDEPTRCSQDAVKCDACAEVPEKYRHLCRGLQMLTDDVFAFSKDHQVRWKQFDRILYVQLMAGIASLCACQENSVEAFKRLTELFEELTGDKVSYLAMPPPSSRTLSLSEDDKRIVTEVVMGMLKLKADNAGLKVH